MSEADWDYPDMDSEFAEIADIAASAVVVDLCHWRNDLEQYRWVLRSQLQSQAGRDFRATAEKEAGV